MSWAATRQTTRIEDTAYCLLGIFNVNMPMIYGEGVRAFIRLQEAIAGESNDFSLFSWRASAADYQMYRGVFATSPSEFRDSGSIRVIRDAVFNPEFLLTNKGLLAKLGRIFLSRRVSPSLSEELKASQNHAFVFRNGFNEANVATNAPEFPFEVIQFAASEQWDSQGRMFVTQGAGGFAAYGYFMPRFGTFHAEELSGAESFILAFGRVQGEEEPWICIASAREDIEIFQAQGDAKKAVRVSLEKTMTGGQMVYCIDLKYTGAPEVHLTGQDGALSHPESFAYRERYGIGQKSVGRQDSSSLTNLWIAENFLEDI
ncbi:hypothetical protein EDB81DRAFT_863095 [Dactylonectria macrodidyma]|uniref:Uncharacterized protein n=1 Tax=Dactylonectria macrodidyma TaxID=307937 RepID=A0A9P9D0Z6_9HYPO|nr:hypothetical protein EDB81DRAFT_863095 [Dactylonectria macrodidyma]